VRRPFKIGEQLKDSFAGRKILVTGGTGSFGNVAVRYFLKGGAHEVRVFSRDEKKQEDMRLAIADPRARFMIGDVRDLRSVSQAMTGVDYVFSAAALKQVPSCEFYPMEAVFTNIVGSENVLNAALDNGVSRVVLLSTDKAVYPVNAMGMTKALMEKVMVAKSRIAEGSGQVFCATRYGNVMASRGSVIPLFIKQAKEGKALTLTDPGMTRFLMSLDDAMDLVLFAFENAKNGDIFVQKAPATTMLNLAIAIKELLGSNSDIKVIGTRHGEKQHEALLNREERVRSDDLGNYYRVHADSRDLNYSLFFSEGQESVTKSEDYSSENTQQLDVDAVKKLLMTLDIVKDEL
jgi:UDP-N-acetylglucosamine 4,6-dehydratase